MIVQNDWVVCLYFRRNKRKLCGSLAALVKTVSEKLSVVFFLYSLVNTFFAILFICYDYVL